MDPDYCRSHVVSEMSDMFRFGVAACKVQAYEFRELKDVALEALEDAVVEFADIALNCAKVTGSRQPSREDVACRLQALLSNHCSEGECNIEPSMRLYKTMEESLERLTGGGMDDFERSEISKDV
ncbi:unnamed protein product [Closterium sp. NIES-65]|nr:unnamed protein product [Closterium sp. NIES-65]